MKERAEKLAEFPFLIGKVLTGMTILLSTVGIKFPFLIGKVLTIMAIVFMILVSATKVVSIPYR